MARDKFWFEHDSNAHSDPLIIKLRMRFGLAGYGAFWMLVEALRDSNEYRIESEMADAICFEYRIEKECFDFMIEIGLFKSDGSFFWSDSLCRRMEAWEAKRASYATRGAAGGRAKAENRHSSATTQAKQSPSPALPIREEKRREEKSTGQKRTEQKKKEEIKDLFVAAAEPPPGTLVWGSYSKAYFRRYGTEPARNAKTNSLCKRLCTLLPAEEAPFVAEYYLTTRANPYAQSGHCLDLLVRDFQKIHTEWKTGQRITSAGAMEMDRLQKTGDDWSEIIAEHAEKEKSK